MFRFTIRDVLWLTVVVGLGTCWHKDRETISQWIAEIKAARAAETVKVEKQRKDMVRQQATYIMLAAEYHEQLARTRAQDAARSKREPSFGSLDLDLPREDVPRDIRLQLEGTEDSATLHIPVRKKWLDDQRLNP